VWDDRQSAKAWAEEAEEHPPLEAATKQRSEDRDLVRQWFVKCSYGLCDIVSKKSDYQSKPRP
jgi:hypothetical protein